MLLLFLCFCVSNCSQVLQCVCISQCCCALANYHSIRSSSNPLDSETGAAKLWREDYSQIISGLPGNFATTRNSTHAVLRLEDQFTIKVNMCECAINPAASVRLEVQPEIERQNLETMKLDDIFPLSFSIEG